MKLFAENPDEMITTFSANFEGGFLEQLSRFHGTKKVLANRIYAEYISNKEHVHMNSTRWSTLGDFVKYLGKESKCVVEECDEGWKIQWIDRDPRLVEKQAAFDNKQQEELDDADRQRVSLERQVAAMRAARAAMGGGAGGEEEATAEALELRRDDSAPLVAVAVMAGSARRKVLVGLGVLAAAGDGGGGGGSSSSTARAPVSALERVMREDEERKARELAAADARLRAQHKAWLHVGCVVKVVNKAVAGGALYKSKATVDAVIADGFGAQCTVDVGGTLVKAVLDQDDLETTVPKAGRRGVLVRGAGRGACCTVLEVRKADFQCDVRVEDGLLKGTVLARREYEDVCKLVGE